MYSTKTQVKTALNFLIGTLIAEKKFVKFFKKINNPGSVWQMVVGIPHEMEGRGEKRESRE